ncbi:hypothetical protein XENTR_v10002639 [Xenopus tropicalis]|nr:hypothetical protein XENTR_v10002639 [Xenopus tropicalis]
MWSNYKFILSLLQVINTKATLNIHKEKKKTTIYDMSACSIQQVQRSRVACLICTYREQPRPLFAQEKLAKQMSSTQLKDM